MSPTPEGTARAKKAWVTIRRRKEAERAKARAESPEIAEIAEAKEAIDAKKAKFTLERDLQVALRADIEQLEGGLTINDGGKEKIGLSGGRTDILAIDANGRPVVIELKAVTADHDAIGQILRYMGDLQDEIGGPVRGIVIAPDFTAGAVAASKPVPSIELQKYRFNLLFKKVSK